MSHGHHHHEAPVAAAAAGEPTSFLSDPSKTSTSRCKRRWNDLVLLRLDAQDAKTYAAKDARFSNEKDLYKLVRERYLLFVNCIESKPGAEPKHPYLYPDVHHTGSTLLSKH